MRVLTVPQQSRAARRRAPRINEKSPRKAGLFR
jgi:hypothetical protein